MSEKKLLTEFLLLYKEFPCLWDNRQVLYTNKEARDQAYEVLLEKYKQIQEDANIMDVKKKIEHMRCCYRREHKKVLLTRANGEDEHIPTLWYYELLQFLNDVCNFTHLEPMSRVRSSADINELKVEYEDSDTLRIKRSKKRKTNLSAIYLPEQHDSDDDDDHDDNDNMLDHEDSTVNQDDYNSTHTTLRSKPRAESEAFGAAIGLQLKDLDPMQKTIAEKLISDVIFHARLNRLTVNSSIISPM